MHFRSGRAGLAAAVAILWLAAGHSAAGAFERNQIASGFNLDQLTSLSGTGPDPGGRNPQARLEWAVATAIPAPWRAHVPVTWRIGGVGAGSAALSFHDGTTAVSSGLLRRPAEELLMTVAHEMGHQIAIALVPAGDGSPPQGFVELLAGTPYNRFDEGWADCVSRVWTGSRLFTRTERGTCPDEAAEYVAKLLADPENLRREGLPSPSPAPSPSPVPSASTVSPSPADGGTGSSSAGRVIVGLLLLVGGPVLLVRLVRALVPDDRGFEP